MLLHRLTTALFARYSGPLVASVGLMAVLLAGGALVLVSVTQAEQLAWTRTPQVQRTGTLGQASSVCVRNCPPNPPMQGDVTLHADRYGPELTVRLTWRRTEGPPPWPGDVTRAPLTCDRDRPWMCRQPGDGFIRATRQVQGTLVTVLVLGGLLTALGLSEGRWPPARPGLTPPATRRWGRP